MRVAIPHKLGRDEVRRRLAGGVGEIAGFIPGGVADVSAIWPNEDRMDLAIHALGGQIASRIDVEDAQVVLTLDLPPALSFVEPMVQRAIEAKGRKLLT